MSYHLRTKLFLVCPQCGEKEWSVQHCVDDALAGKWPEKLMQCEYGPWPCDNRDCDSQIRFAVTRAGEIVDVRAEPRGHSYGYALLKLGDIYLVTEELQSPDYEDSRDYFYHSHQCPTNLLGHVEEVFDATGKDPHGRIRYVASIPGSPETEKRLEDTHSLQALFALFGTDGQPGATDWPEADGGVIPFIAELQRDYVKSKSPKA